MSKIAFIFPGQGSQVVGMGHELATATATTLAKRADEKLAYPLSDLMWNGPQETLTLTYNAQPALLTSSIIALEAFRESGIVADYVAGHSLGEYTALVAAGVLSFEDAVYAVRRRGELMDKAVPAGVGAMSAVLGLDEAALQRVTNEASAVGAVQLANLNCPGQIVISGTKEGVAKAGELAKEAGAKRVIPLDVSGPFHSSLMEPASAALREVFAELTWNEAAVAVIANVDAAAMTAVSDIQEKLIRQLYSPVRWQQTVEALLASGVTTFIEFGPGKVLSGLVKKVSREANTYQVFDEASLQATLTAVKGVEVK